MRRINIAEAAVVDTILSALLEQYYLEPDGRTSQWKYTIDSSYMPDYTRTPLTITPRIKVVDEETEQAYVPTIADVTWTYQNGDSWSPLGAGFTVDNNTGALTIAKNTDPTKPLTLRCVVVYIDPRSGYGIQTEPETITIVCNEDTTLLYQKLQILEPTGHLYDPFVDDEDSELTFNAKVDPTYLEVHDTTGKNPQTEGWYTRTLVQNEYVYTLTTDTSPVEGKHYFRTAFFSWFIRQNNTEVAAENHLAFKRYITTNGNKTGIVVDALYADSMVVVLRAKSSANSTSGYFPTEDSVTVAWDVSKIMATAFSPSGSAVDKENRIMTFDTIINRRGQELKDDLKRRHLALKWFKCNSNQGNISKVFLGNGPTTFVFSDSLRNPTTASGQSSTRIYPEVYLRGAYEQVTCNGEPVTCNGEPVVCRG